MLFKVVLIILLHTLIPHKHHLEMAYEEHLLFHENADDIIDFLRLGFHQDANKDLENYTFTTQNFREKHDLNSFYFLTRCNFTEDKPISVDANPVFKTQSQRVFSAILIRSNGLRAPPDSDFHL